MRLAGLAAVAVLLAFVVRLVQIQGVDAAELAEQGLERRSATMALPAHRGDILDADGAVLATTVERRHITVDQTLVPEFNKGRQVRPDLPAGVPGAALAMSRVLGVPTADLTRRLTGDRRFAYVVKDVEPEVWRAVARLGVPGLFSEQAGRRVYPGGQVGASVVGFLGKDGVPLSGIERARGDDLRGVDGELSYERGKGGQQIATGLTSETEPQDGRDVQLTLDRDLQWKTQEALAAKVRETRAESGYAVVMDPRTGDVLALATVPTFDANRPGAADPADRGNRALVDVFEPGSTSKVITVAAALEERVVTPSSRFLVDDAIRRADRTFNDSHRHPPERLTTAGILAQSSNVGTIRIGEKVPAATMHRYLTGFGLGSPTGAGLPESRGILAAPADWNGSQRYTVLFGQGLSVTALQAAGVFATIANDGVRVRPRLVKATSGPDGRLHPAPPSPTQRVVSAATARQVRLMLESVVGDDGTAVRAAIPGYRVAGKTGTAQAYEDSCACYRGYTASFIGMAPADDPRLVVAVVLQKPVKGYYGGVVAAPVFQDVMAYALRSRGVLPTGTKAPVVPLTYR